MNKKEASLILGYSSSYFSMMRIHNKLCFRYIYCLGKGNLVAGHHKLMSIFRDMKSQLIDYIYGLKHGEIKVFCELLYSIDSSYSSASSAYNSFYNSIYSDTDSISIKMFRLFRKVLKEIKKG